ncbi:MAG: DNA-directed RNA polymerase subunit alpha [Candidatus Magasanikbacteria bacterium]|nr:DNA-directed RNA polymerase subunit alpha [Candidatus Magasanikbacteria bacterium]
MEKIFLPTSVEFTQEEGSNLGTVVMSPCHQGYGTSIGNALRRVLLSSIPGAAVEAVKIDGVQHEFSAIKGVQEDVVEIILNLKQLAVKSFSNEPIRLSLSKKGLGEVTAADFDKNADLELVNPKQKIATITDPSKTLSMEIIIGKGLGYIPASEKESKHLDLGTILVDSFYSPVKDVGYDIDYTRVGDITDFEKLTLNIETNGTVAVKEAVEQAVDILMDYFMLFKHAGPTGEAGEKTESETDESKEELPEE